MKLADLIEPMPGKLAVQIKAVEEMRGGLYLPAETARSLHEGKSTQGTIISIGADADEDPDTFLEVGDLVIFSKYSGAEIRYRPKAEDGNALTRQARAPEERIVILNIKDIIARIRQDEGDAEIVVKS